MRLLPFWAVIVVVPVLAFWGESVSSSADNNTHEQTAAVPVADTAAVHESSPAAD